MENGIYIRKKLIYEKLKEIEQLKQKGTKRYNNLFINTLEILYRRGINTEDKISKFINPSLLDLHDTREMKDAEKGVNIIIEAIMNKEKIIIYGDYDCDGICATACMLLALKNIGANIDYYINDRFKYGYGMHIDAINEILAQHPDVKLIITVDNGISAIEPVNYCKSKGIKVVITDHHEVGKQIPNADAVINPKRKDDSYPFKDLCGTGVAFKLMLLLYYELNQKLDFVYNLLDIVALATVGDIVPLIDENRIIVKEGLSLIKEERRPVFKIFREITEMTNINAHFTLAYLYVPIINAIGRINGNVNLAVELFLTDDEEKIREVLKILKDYNEERKKLTEQQFTIAEQMLEKKGLKDVIVLYNPEFHEGIIGLIAGRLKEKYNRPVFIFTKNHKDNVLKGSARSIDNYHIKEVLDEIAEEANIFVGYGGHKKAAGLSIKEDKLNELENSLLTKAKKRLTEEDFKLKLVIDTVIDADDLNQEFIEELNFLEPFGEGFEKPLLGLRNFKGDGFRYLGEQENHVKIYNKNLNLSVIIWGEAEKYKQKGEPLNIKAIGYPEINVYNNNIYIQFITQDDLFFDASKKTSK